MLSPYDDLPIHQAGAPVAQPASADPNVYDRYFFCGYDATASAPFYFVGALGHYPNRDVMDAAFSIAIDGEQYAVLASQRIPAERHTTKLGPIEVEVVEPLRTLRYTVDAPRHGLRADLTFAARTPAIEEPRQTMMSGQKVTMDSTRLAQSGTWSGWIEIDGNHMDLDPSSTFGTRDRSWGLRPIGEPPGGAPPLHPTGICWLWGPTNFADRCSFFGVSENAEGLRSFESGVVSPALAPGAATYGEEAWATVRHAHRVDVDVHWRPGTRRAAGSTVRFHWRDGAVDELGYEPLVDFHMKGVGYTDPVWGHGRYLGEYADTGNRWKLDDLDPLAPENFHVHQLCKVHWNGDVGQGVFEQVVIGPHVPSGFADWFDGAPA
ncbi:MAG TPA: hypothetical protein VHA73_04055 [Acidimicrobiales bacterium]|jgi:hypothetical protein|nr:hypothetical protein [Acidimicrobiales bacterium]